MTHSLYRFRGWRSRYPLMWLQVVANEHTWIITQGELPECQIEACDLEEVAVNVSHTACHKIIEGVVA